MTAKDLEDLIERVRRWPKERQQDANSSCLADLQAREVVRIQDDIRNGNGTLATDEQMAALWKSCGL
jgi:hypothetical protein